MSDLEKNNRIWYFDFLRIFACIAVIVLHVSAQKFDMADVGSYAWNVFNVYDSFVRWAVPVFVMISGALFLDPNRNMDYRSFYKKNTVRLITAFVFWSAGYALVDYLQGVRLRTVAFNFISGGVHLWFLYMMVGLYLALPLLRKITESERLTNYFLVLWFVFSILFYSVKKLVMFYDPRFSGWFDSVSNDISLNIVGGYTGYFILGYWLYKRDISKKMRLIIYALGLCGFAATVVLTYIASRKNSSLNTSFYENSTISIVFMASAVFVFFKYHSPQQIKNKIIMKAVHELSDCSFGIYLVHFIFVKFSQEIIKMHTMTINPIVSVPLITGGVFVCSFIVSFVLNRIPILKKYIV